MTYINLRLQGGGEGYAVFSATLNKKIFKVALSTKMWAATSTPCTPYQDEPLPVEVMAHLLYIRCVEYAYYSADLTWQECQTIIFQMVFASSGKTTTSSKVSSFAGFSTNANLRPMKFPRR